MLNDVRNEYVSVEGAERDYGIVIDSSTWTVDLAATQILRDSRRRSRGKTLLPVVAWEDE